ncbi:DUF4349 domain-containing protein [Fundicoccus culcitae]|uniref:DUF4349 domain-containing protein n=1 Tax=Fundicoccus culcitae TaxID=2969821 RepID=A0ABY5P2U6_9LACT|nr:DUF4349 domain-containing protein [Fundicoccus culcitae]UUX32810.1 DUF4349 domain-containing protein [Fundicoccus culcitae]
MKKWMIVLAGVLFLAACGEQAPNETEMTTPTTYEETANRNVTDVQLDDDANYYDEARPEDNRYLIHTAYVGLQTVDYESSKQQLFDFIGNSDAYIQYQNEYTSSNYYQDDRGLHTLSLTLRVPQASFEEALATLTSGGIGEVVQNSRGSEDVTRSMTDLDIRIESIDARIGRLNDLLDEATLISDIIEIQYSVEEAILERDQLLSEQATLEDQVNDSTITIELREVRRLDDGITTNQSFWDRIKDALVDTGYQTIIVLQEALLSVIYFLPYLLLLIIIGLYFLLIHPFVRRRRKNRKRTVETEKEIVTDNSNGIVQERKEISKETSNNSTKDLHNDEKDVN